MVVQTKDKMLEVVDLVVVLAQQQILAAILEQQVQIVTPIDKDILVVLVRAHKVAAVVVPVLLEMLDLELHLTEKVVLE
tara:strand:- start:757 stop:993 length:237 start_codon:yes stop_codon:yes gene_type:complete